MEHAIGSIITLPDVRKAKVVEGGDCHECIFAMDDNGCVFIAGECASDDRTDHKNIIYKEVEDNG